MVIREPAPDLDSRVLQEVLLTIEMFHEVPKTDAGRWRHVMDPAGRSPIATRHRPGQVRLEGRRKPIVLLGLAGIAAIAVMAGLGLVRADRNPVVLEGPVLDEPVVNGWPGPTRNPPGLYSWDGPGGNWLQSWMHNGYGSGDVAIRLDLVPKGAIPDEGATAVGVAGHDGIHRRIDARREEWFVDIEGKTIVIRLEARHRTSTADLAEAHAIIRSMRAEPQDNNLGFRVVFTLTTNDWDSG